MKRVVAALARAKWARFSAVLLLGLIVGAAGATLRLGRVIDRVMLDNAILIDEVERLAGELASRERALSASQRLPVRSVEIEIESPLEEHVRVHVQQLAHDLLRHLVGEEIESLNPLLIEKALQRTLHVDKQDFAVTPTLIVLGSRLLVRLRVEEGQFQVSP